MIVVAGEALVDLTPAATGEAEALVPHAGGGPANTATALGRLDVPVAFFGSLSRDGFGAVLRRHLEDSAVDLSLVGEVDAPTTLAVVHLRPGAEAEYGFYFESTSAFAATTVPDLPGGVEALHVGSLGLVLEPLATTLEDTAAAHPSVVLSVDPNIRPGVLEGRAGARDRLQRWLGRAGIVRMSESDAAWLFPGADLGNVARSLLDSGVALVAVTRGPAGAEAHHRGGVVRVDAPGGPVVDTVGAGDAFNAGLLAWLHDRSLLSDAGLASLTTGPLGEAVVFAQKVAALTCGRAGADPPRRADIADPTAPPTGPPPMHH